MTMAATHGSNEEERQPALLFVNQHYWPDVASPGQHLTDLAEYLASEGMRVTVLSSTLDVTVPLLTCTAGALGKKLGRV